MSEKNVYAVACHIKRLIYELLIHDTVFCGGFCFLPKQYARFDTYRDVKPNNITKFNANYFRYTYNFLQIILMATLIVKQVLSLSMVTAVVLTFNLHSFPDYHCNSCYVFLCVYTYLFYTIYYFMIPPYLTNFALLIIFQQRIILSQVADLSNTYNSTANNKFLFLQFRSTKK